MDDFEARGRAVGGEDFEFRGLRDAQRFTRPEFVVGDQHETALFVGVSRVLTSNLLHRFLLKQATCQISLDGKSFASS